MILWGLGLTVLGIIGLTLQWNPILEQFPPVMEKVIKNIGLIQAISVSSFVGAVIFFIGGLKSKSS